jgi:hypothetical protein
MGGERDLGEIREALRHDRMCVTTATGWQRPIAAECPEGCGPASVRTIYTERGVSGPEITGVRFRCNECGNVFMAAAEGMVLG